MTHSLISSENVLVRAHMVWPMARNGLSQYIYLHSILWCEQATEFTQELFWFLQPPDSLLFYTYL